MPVLKNPKHERFSQELAKGKSQTEAYEKAGYKPDRGAASRLSTNVSIQARVAELQARVAERITEKAAVTAASLMEEADEIKRAAYLAGQFGAAVAALKEKGILSGKRIERQEQGKPGAFDSMSEAELEDYIARGAGTIGAGGENAGAEAGAEEAIPTRRPH